MFCDTVRMKASEGSELAVAFQLLWGQGDRVSVLGRGCDLWRVPGITGKFGLGVQNEAGQRLIEF